MRSNSVNMNDYSVIDLLNNYNKYKAKTNMLASKNLPESVKTELEKLKQALETIDICVAGLISEDAELIKLFFYNGLTGRKLANQICMSKSTIYRKKDRAVAQIEENFAKFLKVDTKMGQVDKK